jgi:hypothetical protein
MPRNQKLLGRGVTSRDKTRTALEIPGLMPASYGRIFPEAHPVHASSLLAFSDKARFIIAAPPFLPLR